ncbi:MAG: hypothetical protein JW982_15825 [Spirochaetes bacterium]|nr:hypothetical protein [Spirochaetota bacterium]
MKPVSGIVLIILLAACSSGQKHDKSSKLILVKKESVVIGNRITVAIDARSPVKADYYVSFLDDGKAEKYGSLIKVIMSCLLEML